MKIIFALSLIVTLSFIRSQPVPPTDTSVPNVTVTNTSEAMQTCMASQTPSSNSSAKAQCQQDLYAAVQQSMAAYTEMLAERFSFCVSNATQERETTFDFSGNLTFLSDCFYETKGAMLQYMCSGPELKAYLNSLVYLIQISATTAASTSILDVNCNQTQWSQGCEAGWAQAIEAPVTNMDQLYGENITIPIRTNLLNVPCCDGFFCPRGLSCMIPCPLGAQCTKANYSQSLCQPYGYPLTPGEGYECGGANLWASLSVSRGTFCPAGFYCPSTTDVRKCDKGHFCRQGSTFQSQCFRLADCEEESTTQHIETYGVILIAGLALVVMIMYNCSNQMRHVKEKRKAKTREKAIQQVKEHLSAIDKWKSAASKLGRTISGRPKRSTDGRSLHAASMQRSERASARFKSIAEGRTYQELDNIGDSRRSSFYAEDRSEHDLYEVPTSLESSSNSRKSVLHTRSQILRYAYGQIEKEKALQNKRMSWNEVLQAGQQQESSTRLKIEITFQDLSLFLKSNGKKILCNVTGKLSPGRVTAVMGPSGAGKTTFLNALAGKAYNSYTTGVVLINGKPDPIKCYRKVIGFVPQDDIVHGNLTVEENLWFSARYRLPVDMPKAEKVLVVERIIDALGLEQIRDSKVGTVEKRGISGGQRKRVNVGLEMVMEPSLLILDEPTSGLDSTSSFLVLRALRREAHVGVNVGVVLHQPSYGLFKMFDDVMFLAKGGRTVYLGPVDEVESYFSGLGIKVPERINPPDHFMDVLEGITKPSGQDRFDPTILPLKWIQYKGYDVSRDLQAESHNQRGSEKSFIQDLWDEFTSFLKMRFDDVNSTIKRMEDLSNRKTPSFFSQFKLIISRLMLQRIREARLQTQDYLILLLCGVCLGLISPSRDESLGSNSYAYVIIALSLLCMIAALRTFTNDKLQYWRESASGINRVAYFIAKDTVDHVNTVMKPVVFLSMFYFFNNPRSTFVENYVITLSMVYCVTGIAYVFAITLESGPAQLCSVFVPIIFTLLATKKDLPDIVMFIKYMDYAHWALQAYITANAKRYPGVWLLTRCSMIYAAGYDVNNWTLCIGMLFVIGFVARFVAMLCLILCNRKRQQ